MCWNEETVVSQSTLVEMVVIRILSLGANAQRLIFFYMLYTVSYSSEFAKKFLNLRMFGEYTQIQNLLYNASDIHGDLIEMI